MVTGGKKNGCRGAEHVLAGAYSPTVQKCVLDASTGNPGLGNVAITVKEETFVRNLIS